MKLSIIPTPAGTGYRCECLDLPGTPPVRALDPANKCPTVVGQLTRGSRQRRSWCVMDGERIRHLSIAELARAQGFPPDYLFAAQHSRMELMVGRAIQIHLGRAILKAIADEALALGQGTGENH